jgi:3-hydroxymyristoyl/3-hydroxydecanoyl-(acyl carrier protein) dehydratase
MKFRFVDKITSWSPYQRIAGVKVVSFEEYSLKESFGDEPRLPETLLLESFLQLGNWLILLSSDFKEIGMAVRISEVRFHGFVAPGQRLQMAVNLARRREDGYELTGEGRVNGRTIISGLGCLAVPVPAVELMDPDDMRVLFSEIYEPGETITA